MPELFSLLLGYPTLVYTVLLSLCLVYWLLVMLGVADIDWLHLHLDVDVDADGAFSAAASLVSALGLRGVPVTIIFSFLVFWAWLMTALGAALLQELLPFDWLQYLAGTGLIVGAGLVSFYLTRFSCRPLKRVFVQQGQAASSHSLVGRQCTVTSGSVSDTWGEARVMMNGQDFVVQVHTRDAGGLKKGDDALVLEYDEGADRYLISAAGDNFAARVS